MLYKKPVKKSDKIYRKNVIFIILLAIYTCGLCAGCAFALKNSENFEFVHRVTLTHNFNAALRVYTGLDLSFLVRDLLRIIFLVLLKYSGILKGFTVSVPFAMALQNACIYISLLCSGVKNNIILFMTTALKNSSIIFLILIFCGIIVTDIIDERENHRKDIKTATVYSISISLIYVIDYFVRIFIYPGA